jgi:DNA-binding transcriptional LysR family regulator
VVYLIPLIWGVDLIAALRSFLRVVEVGSFSAVASEEGITQPAISRKVTALEQHFGVRLVQRSTHAITLTEEGRDLVPSARQLVDSAEALSNSIGRRRSQWVCETGSSRCTWSLPRQ